MDGHTHVCPRPSPRPSPPGSPSGPSALVPPPTPGAAEYSGTEAGDACSGWLQGGPSRKNARERISIKDMITAD